MNLPSATYWTEQFTDKGEFISFLVPLYTCSDNYNNVSENLKEYLWQFDWDGGIFQFLRLWVWYFYMIAESEE